MRRLVLMRPAGRMAILTGRKVRWQVNSGVEPVKDKAMIPIDRGIYRLISNARLKHEPEPGAGKGVIPTARNNRSRINAALLMAKLVDNLGIADRVE